MTLLILVAALIIMIGALAGGLFKLGKLGQWTEKRMPLLTSFAAGVFLVTSLALLREAFEFGSTGLVIGSAVGGFVLIMLIHHLIPEAHHHHDEDCDHDHTVSGKKILIADAIHNLGDGVILVPAFLVSTQLGIVTAVSIFVHELVQEISEYYVLRKAGYSVKKALGLNFLASATILVGVVIGLLLSESLTLQVVLLAASAGAFLQIVFQDLMPRNTDQLGGYRVVQHIIAFVLGLVIIAGVSAAAPHTHEHGDHDHGHGHSHESEHHHDEEHGHDDEHEEDGDHMHEGDEKHDEDHGHEEEKDEHEHDEPGDEDHDGHGH